MFSISGVVKDGPAKLIVIATPIGDKDDITLRALKYLKELSIFFVEDTREFKKLLGLHGISLTDKKVFSMASHNMPQSVEKALSFLEKGFSLGLCCDRGTPGISDPGALLVKEARNKGFKILPIPGASSIATLLSISGESEKFIFLGFFPKEQNKQKVCIDLVTKTSLSLLFFESHKRITKTLKYLLEHFPNGEIFLGREMTKIFEEYQWYGHKKCVDEIVEKGEFTILFKPNCSAKEKQTDDLLNEEIALRAVSEKQWAKKISEKYLSSASDIYNQLQKIKNLNKMSDK